MTIAQVAREALRAPWLVCMNQNLDFATSDGMVDPFRRRGRSARGRRLIRSQRRASGPGANAGEPDFLPSRHRRIKAQTAFILQRTSAELDHRYRRWAVYPTLPTSISAHREREWDALHTSVRRRHGQPRDRSIRPRARRCEMRAHLQSDAGNIPSGRRLDHQDDDCRLQPIRRGRAHRPTAPRRRTGRRSGAQSPGSTRIPG